MIVTSSFVILYFSNTHIVTLKKGYTHTHMDIPHKIIVKFFRTAFYKF